MGRAGSLTVHNAFGITFDQFICLYASVKGRGWRVKRKKSWDF